MMPTRCRIAAVAIGVLLATACGSDGGGSAAPAPTAPTSSVTPAAAGFCAAANAFVSDPNVFFVTEPDAAMFDTFDVDLAALAVAAPEELQADIASLRVGFAAIGTAYEAVGYEPEAELPLDPGVQSATVRSSEALQRYLVDNCDLSEERDRQIAAIATAFGIDDLSIAECINTQFGDVANIASSDLSPALLTREVCGTSLFALLSGTGG